VHDSLLVCSMQRVMPAAGVALDSWQPARTNQLASISVAW
jgi:hypothetical protein